MDPDPEPSSYGSGSGSGKSSGSLLNRLRIDKTAIGRCFCILVKYPEPRQLIRFPINPAEATEEQMAKIQLIR
jgi:hypothetical protein